MQPQAKEEADSATGEGTHREEGIQNIEGCFIYRAGYISRAAHLQHAGMGSSRAIICPSTVTSSQVVGGRQLVASNSPG